MKTKQKILMVYPGDFYSKNWGRFITLKPHMVYIYTYLKEFFDVIVIDLENEFLRPEDEKGLEEFKKKSLKRILSIDTDYIAISCWSSLNYLSSVYFAEKIKQQKPKMNIIVGGYHPTLVPEDFLYENTPFDHVVEGEIYNIFKIFGLEDAIKKNTYEIFPDYVSYPYYDSQKTIGMFLGAGCPFHCRYCMEYKKKWSSLPVKTAIDYILKINEQISPSYIPLFDACFGFDKNWRKEFLNELIEKNLDLYFWLETRVDLLDEEDIKLLSKLKIKIDFGVDSLSKTMLRIMRKTASPESFLDNFLNISKVCSEYGILHDMFLIFNHPGETKKTYEEFKQFFIQKVSPELKGGYLRIKYQRFSYYPGSYIYNHKNEFEEKYGFKALHPQWWKESVDQYSNSRDIIPSIDDKGKPYYVPLKETSKMVKEFNGLSKEQALWERLHSFNI
ncbi:MAG: cobalamin-dependent protein [Proteobacteria bacterium]|nr:cobalamin-dependent protein [Pseudomonadota bacterium]MBU1584453.1 cobalamin-dependent protein [Pseudomonadota bacterium]MBU2452969.1 cobalamin-dependent protein [Pseudomonadota bacterium]